MRRGRPKDIITIPDSECPGCGGPVTYQELPNIKGLCNLAPPHPTQSLCLRCVRKALCKMTVIWHGDVAESAGKGAGKPSVDEMRERIFGTHYAEAR